jgi:hypothetical protein
MKYALLTLVLLPGLAPLLHQQAAQSTSPSYARDVRPFLAKYCLECHNQKTAKGKLNLETFEGLMKGSSSGPVVVPGKADDSPLVLLPEGKDMLRMPPKEARQPKAKEVAVLRAWVAGGAKDDSADFKITLPDIKPTRPVQAAISALSYRSDNKALAVALHHKVVILDPALNNIVNRIGPLDDVVTALAYKPGSDYLAVAHGTPGSRGLVGLYRVMNGNVTTSGHVRDLDGHADVILDMAFSPNGKALATCSYDRTVKLWDVDSGKLLRTLKEHSDAVYGVCFNPDGSLLASAGADRAVKVWRVDTGKLLYTLSEATDWVYAVAWSPDGQRLAAAGVDKSIRVWQPGDSGAKLLQSVFAHEGPVIRLTYARDSKTLYSLGEDRTVKAWDVRSMAERKVYARQPENILSLAVRPDQKQLALGRFDGALLILDEKTGDVLAEPLRPAPPQPNKITPAAGQRGKEIRAAVEGKDLEDVTEAVVSHPGVSVKVLAEGKTPTSLQLAIKFDQATPAGKYAITLNSPGGQAAVNFIVDPFAEVPEKEPNNSPGTGQVIKLPASVVGSLQQTGDVDWYRFEVTAGQQLGVQVLAKELGSKVEPFLTLADAQGAVLATSEDGLLGHTIAEAGPYAIGIRDRDFRGGDKEWHYRLHLGEIPIVTGVFPLGVQRGQSARVAVDGVFLGDAQSVQVQAGDVAVGTKLPLKLTTPYGPPLGKLTVLVDEFPDVIAGTTNEIPVPGTGNGKIAKAGAADTWRFAAKKGQRLILEVNARRLGSPLDSFMEILDLKGNPVPRATLRSLAKTYVTFRDHDSAGAGIRIESWSELAVNDFILCGNELLKIRELPPNPDADCVFFSERGQRIGWLDTTPAHHAQGTPMYKVSIHAPGTQFPPNGFPVVTLYYRNDDGGPGFGRDSRLFFDPPADSEYIVRIGDSRGQGGPHYSYRLTVRPPRPSFNVSFNPTAPAVWKGGAIPITVAADRIDGFDGPIQVQLDNLPPGFSAPATTIPTGENSTAFALYANPTAPAPAAPLKLTARATVEGDVIVKQVTSGMATLKDGGDLTTTTAESEVTLKPGGQVKLKVTVQRYNNFGGRVPVEVRGLPHGVRVLDIGLNGILITEQESERVVTIYAEPWVEAMDHPIVVLTKREGKNTEHAAKSVMLRVVK